MHLKIVWENRWEKFTEVQIDGSPPKAINKGLRGECWTTDWTNWVHKVQHTLPCGIQHWIQNDNAVLIFLQKYEDLKLQNG